MKKPSIYDIRLFITNNKWYAHAKWSEIKYQSATNINTTFNLRSADVGPHNTMHEALTSIHEQIICNRSK